MLKDTGATIHYRFWTKQLPLRELLYGVYSTQTQSSIRMFEMESREAVQGLLEVEEVVKYILRMMEVGKLL